MMRRRIFRFARSFFFLMMMIIELFFFCGI
jgi:hypothetical protein